MDIMPGSDCITYTHTYKFHALSNGALVFAVKSNIVCRKIEETIHGNCVCTQPAFSANRIELTAKQSAPFERTLKFGLRFYFYFPLYMISALEGHGNAYGPVRIPTCVRRVLQTNRNT